MIPAIVYAIPAFVLLVVVEALSYRFLPDDEEQGYELRDTVTSMSMGAGSQVVGLPWKVFAVLAYAGVYTLSPWQLSPSSVWTWVLLFFADDLAYYVFHRAHHRVRVLWASHVVHHSSVRFNLSTALRQSWTPMTTLPFWLPLALLGIPPWMILLQQSFSLVYQFFLHTERVGTLWRPVEWIFNTPSHHRVHHGSNNRYLDKNYGGILIVWDRLGGTFEPEGSGSSTA
ncbi:sterol desaturase family protein [Streptomyces zhihengii]